MSLVELMLSMSLFSIAVGAITHSVPVFQKHVDQTRALREELSQVEHVLQIITRSIQQAGYTNLTELSPTSPKRHATVTHGLQVFQQAILRNEHAQEPSMPHGYAANSRIADALLIQHQAHGHFDCLGRKITLKRTYQGVARTGFFLQMRGKAQAQTGVLICQSLTNKGQIQNDVLLTGIKDFKVRQEAELITIDLTMESGRHYSRTVARQNQVAPRKNWSITG